MKARLVLSLTFGVLILASLMFSSTATVHAGCNGPNDPNPCPEKGEKEKKPTETPIPPTATEARLADRYSECGFDRAPAAG